jgi:cytochrome P450
LIDEPYKSTIVALSNSRVEGTETIAKIKEIISEAVRLAPAVPGVIRETTSDATVGDVKYARGTQVFLSVVDANYDVS